MKGRRKELQRAYQGLAKQEAELERLESTLTQLEADPESLWRQEVEAGVGRAEARLRRARERLAAFRLREEEEAERNRQKLLQVIGASMNPYAPVVERPELLVLVEEKMKAAQRATMGEVQRIQSKLPKFESLLHELEAALLTSHQEALPSGLLLEAKERLQTELEGLRRTADIPVRP